MNTFNTEKQNKVNLPGLVHVNYKKEKVVITALFVFLLLQFNIKAYAGDDKWQFTIASGIHSFYAPVENLKWDNSRFMVSGGINLLLGQKQLFSAGLQFGYAQNSYQGDAVSLQFLVQVLPVTFKRIELGFGTGAGYRFSGYPSSPLKWNGNSWEDTNKYKGIFQIPFQLSAGFRSLNFASVQVIPFAAYHLQALFGYNPDFVPLPDSSLMFGFKFRF